MTDKDADDAFFTDFSSHPSLGTATPWMKARREQTGRTRASWHMREKSGELSFGDISTFLQRNTSGTTTSVAVVIESVDLAWMLQLWKCWNIAPSFFAEHAVDVAKDAYNPWYPILPDNWTNLSKPLVTNIDATQLLGSPKWADASVWHIDGCLTPAQDDNAVRENTFNYISRQRSQDIKHPANTSTRISSWDSRSEDKLDLILLLVDGIYALKATAGIRHLAELHMPLSRNRGGLVIPQLFSQPTFRLFECLQSFFSHSWHFNVLFSNRDRVALIGPDTFAYLLAASQWETNLRYADKQIKHISFEELRQPSTAINNRLHDLRKDLDYLRSGVYLAKEWIPATTQIPLFHLRAEFTENIIPPGEAFTSIQERASELQKFLMDTFTLLLSSISIQEAELGVQQSIRAQRLTTLAFIYVPLSFVTSIYGMNVAEINGSPLSIWVPAVTLVATLLVTAAVFAAYARRQLRQRRR